MRKYVDCKGEKATEMKKSMLFLTMIFALSLSSGCGQTNNGAVKDTPQEVQTETTAEPISDPESVPEPEVVSLPSRKQMERESVLRSLTIGVNTHQTLCRACKRL